MMIQIPVENAIKHGLRDKEGEKRLSITVFRQDGNIIISIEDNGTGFRLQTGCPAMQSTGTGLKVLNQTIELLNAGNSVPITILIKKVARERMKTRAASYNSPCQRVIRTLCRKESNPLSSFL